MAGDLYGELGGQRKEGSIIVDCTRWRWKKSGERNTIEDLWKHDNFGRSEPAGGLDFLRTFTAVGKIY